MIETRTRPCTTQDSKTTNPLSTRSFGKFAPLRTQHKVTQFFHQLNLSDTMGNFAITRPPMELSGLHSFLLISRKPPFM